MTLKERWVAALRSGEYKQTAGALHDQHGYCCLGVLCEVADLSDPVTLTDANDYDPNMVPWRSLAMTDEFEEGRLLVHQAGLTDDEASALATLNDQGVSFDEIADEIESESAS